MDFLSEFEPNIEEVNTVDMCALMFVCYTHLTMIIFIFIDKSKCSNLAMYK